MYSEVGDSHFQGKHRSNGHRKTHPVSARAQSTVMKPIPAEESDEERGSEAKGSDEGEEKEEEQEEDVEEDEYSDEDANRESALDERAEIKLKNKEKALTKKEDDQLCGPRFVKKIDDFIFAVSIEAGLAVTEDKSKNFAGGNGTNGQDMLQTGNTSLFQLEKTKNDDQGAQ